MASLTFPLSPSLIPTPLHHRHRPNKLTFATVPPRLHRPCAALRSPRGFGPTPAQKPKRSPKKRADGEDDDGEEGEKEQDYYGDDTIPEAVTNRMMRRVGLSVGIPLFVGLSLFPLFYYLKVVAKVDVPTWIPLIFSFFFFGAALLGVSYGIVSASWDPLREGSLLGWNEARRNWPVFWDSLRRGSTAPTNKRR